MIENTIAYARWLLSDEPSQAWYRAWVAARTDIGRRPFRWMAKQLRIDPQDPRAWFALAGFAPMEVEGKWHIAAAVPAIDSFNLESLPGDEVVIVDPEANTATLLGEPGAALVVPWPQDSEIFVHFDPMKWLRAWADERVVFLELRKDAITRSRVVPTFTGEPPAALAIGKPEDVPWSRLHARIVRTDFEHAKAVKRAIFRSAHLPTVEAA